MNLFLGIYRPRVQPKPLWEMESDFYLHNNLPYVRDPPSSYIRWFNPAHLSNRRLLAIQPCYPKQFDYYYRTNKFTSLDDLFALKVMSTNSK